MSGVDLYAGVGYAIELLARSGYHGPFPFGHYLEVEILPALKRCQARFYLSKEGIPTGLATWAWISEEVEKDVHASGRALREYEWNCGQRLFFNDFIAPYGNLREVIRDLTHMIFPTHCATSLRRNPDGTARQIKRWIGKDYARSQRRLAK